MVGMWFKSLKMVKVTDQNSSHLSFTKRVYILLLKYVVTDHICRFEKNSKCIDTSIEPNQSNL